MRTEVRVSQSASQSRKSAGGVCKEEVGLGGMIVNQVHFSFSIFFAEKDLVSSLLLDVNYGTEEKKTKSDGNRCLGKRSECK